MILDGNSPRPEIVYPCEWEYKIIGKDVTEMIAVIEEAVNELQYDIRPSNISKSGKYKSLNLKVEVPNELVRDLIFEKLDKSEIIKMVL